jgi:hypothetical protein
MRTKRLTTEIAWLWLPLFIGTCFVLGCYRSYIDHPARDGAGTCSASTQLERFLDCK